MLTPSGSSAEPLWLQKGIPKGLLENRELGAVPLGAGKWGSASLARQGIGSSVEMSGSSFLVLFFGPINHLFCWPEPCPARCSMVRAFSGKVGGSKLQFHPRLSQQHHNCCQWKRVMIQAHSSSPGDGEEKRDAPASAASSMVLPVFGTLQDLFLRVQHRLYVLARRKETSSPGQEGAVPRTGLSSSSGRSRIVLASICFHLCHGSKFSM